MSDIVIIEVPLLPPSVNHYVKHTRRGQHYVTGEAQAFKDAVALLARGKTLKHLDNYVVCIDVWLGKGAKGDIDNFPKVVLDGLRDARVISTDAKVTRLIVSKRRDKESRTRITVGEGPKP